MRTSVSTPKISRCPADVLQQYRLWGWRLLPFFMWSLPSGETRSWELRQEMPPHPSWTDKSEPDSLKATISNLQRNYPTVSSVKKSCLGHGDSPWSCTKDDKLWLNSFYLGMCRCFSVHEDVSAFSRDSQSNQHGYSKNMVQSYADRTHEHNDLGIDSWWVSRILSHTFPYILRGGEKERMFDKKGI